MITLTIDDQAVQVIEGRTILEAARGHSIPIPTLCYHEALEPFGACRVCVVELENRRGGMLVPACSYPCEEGLIVRTNSEKVRRSRRMTIELLMAASAHVPLIRAMADDLGVGEPRFKLEQPDDCILCGLCVRACREIVGVSAISLVNRGIEKEVSPPFHVASNSCIGCGTCVLVCPTGAITFADITGGASTVHAMADFDAIHCHICGEHPLAPQFADHATVLGESIEAKTQARQEVAA